MAEEIEKYVKEKYKSFNETYAYCAFALAISLLYPNMHNFRKKIIVFIIIVSTNSLILFWFSIYTFKTLITLDMYNLSRNILIGVLAVLFFFKIFYVNFKTRKFAALLQQMTDDYLAGNDMEEDYQAIYDLYIKQGKQGQKCWIFIPIFLSAQFPIYAGGSMIYENLKSDVGKKYMVHEMELKFIEHKQYDSPYFELMFAYNLVQCLVLSPNYAGFDGSFCIATTHLQLKLKLMSHKVYRAFKDAKDRFDLEAKIKEAIKDHQRAITFYNDVQDIYGGWLFTVFLVTSIVISMNLYQMSQGTDPKHTIFGISGVIHMFAPCYFSTNLVQTSEDLGSELYCSDWEVWADPVVTKLLMFMIARAQQPLLLTGKGIVYFNMQLFISVLQTSYSFFTLICS